MNCVSKLCFKFLKTVSHDYHISQNLSKNEQYKNKIYEYNIIIARDKRKKESQYGARFVQLSIFLFCLQIGICMLLKSCIASSRKAGGKQSFIYLHFTYTV